MDIGLHNSCNWAWNAYGKSSTDIVPGQVLTDEEMNRLVDDLFAVSTPNYTPDGKTVLAVLKEDDLEKMFK